VEYAILFKILEATYRLQEQLVGLLRRHPNILVNRKALYKLHKNIASLTIRVQLVIKHPNDIDTGSFTEFL